MNAKANGLLEDMNNAGRIAVDYHDTHFSCWGLVMVLERVLAESTTGLQPDVSREHDLAQPQHGISISDGQRERPKICRHLIRGHQQPCAGTRDQPLNHSSSPLREASLASTRAARREHTVRITEKDPNTPRWLGSWQVLDRRVIFSLSCSLEQRCRLPDGPSSRGNPRS